MGNRTRLLTAGVLALLTLPAGSRAEEALRAHVAIDDPAILSHEEAETAYGELKTMMEKDYGLSDYPPAKSFMTWRRFNTAPYLSATHGQRYVNNYVNALGSAYGMLDEEERYPAGAVFAKDSISALPTGEILPGALFIMEKLEAGLSTGTGDWRYVMILPDGSLYGDSTGEHADRVAYCHGCHAAKAEADYLFFIPEAYRQ